MEGGAPRRRGGSWQITRTAFQTPALALVMLSGMLVIGELATRNRTIRDRLLIPSVGSSSRGFELQLNALERFVAAGGPIDCLIVGNSTALMDVDPQALSAAYETRIGAPLRCFNFGVAGMTGSAVGTVAPILAERYRPSLVLYVASARDLGYGVSGPQLANEAWVQYQRGTFSLSGLLAAHSSLMQYYLAYRLWLVPARWPAARTSGGTTAAGFFPVESRLGLSDELWAHTRKAYATVASQPLSPAELSGFGAVLELTGVGISVVVIEPPAHLRLRHWAHGTTSFYTEAIAGMRAATRRRHVPFWRTPLRLVPADAWADFVHLEHSGATRVSGWLGERIARAVQSGRLHKVQRQVSQ